MEYHYIECHCTSAEHTLRFTLDQDLKFSAIYVDVQLNNCHGFFGRLWLALKYIFGHQCRFGHWDETILVGDQVRKMRDLCEQHLKQCNKVDSIFIDTTLPKAW